MEEEREKIRKGIRDKVGWSKNNLCWCWWFLGRVSNVCSTTHKQYNLKKKEAASMDEPDELQKRDSFSSETSLKKRKKSPDELVSEGEEDELTSMLCCI